MKRSLLLTGLLLTTIYWGCTQSSETEKHQGKRNNIVNVRDKIKEIEIEEVLIGRNNQVNIIGDYLLIADNLSNDELIHLFDKNNFRHVAGAGYKGQGPGEIANMGYVAVNEPDRILYVSDHGKNKIFSYELDSVIANPFYIPGEKMKMKERMFPGRYQYINDTLCVGLIIEPTGNYGFKQSIAKWNMTTGDIKTMKYTHPEIEKKRVSFAVSTENNIYVECYHHHDLMTICSLDEEALKYNIFGKKWNNETSNKISFYGDVAFCNDKIIALYHDGENTFFREKSGEIKGTYPTKFIVFDTNGNYMQTLETGYRIARFCYDKDNNRIIMSLDDDIQFAYLDLKGLTLP